MPLNLRWRAPAMLLVGSVLALVASTSTFGQSTKTGAGLPVLPAGPTLPPGESGAPLVGAGLPERSGAARPNGEAVFPPPSSTLPTRFAGAPQPNGIGIFPATPSSLRQLTAAPLPNGVAVFPPARSDLPTRFAGPSLPNGVGVFPTSGP
jgi:hypothetical protein